MAIYIYSPKAGEHNPRSSNLYTCININFLSFWWFEASPIQWLSSNLLNKCMGNQTWPDRKVGKGQLKSQGHHSFSLWRFTLSFKIKASLSWRFSIYGLGSHLGHLASTIFINFCPLSEGGYTWNLALTVVVSEEKPLPTKKFTMNSWQTDNRGFPKPVCPWPKIFLIRAIVWQRSSTVTGLVMGVCVCIRYTHFWCRAEDLTLNVCTHALGRVYIPHTHTHTHACDIGLRTWPSKSGLQVNSVYTT